MCRHQIIGVALGFTALSMVLPTQTQAQDPFLSFDFDDGDISAFFVPIGLDAIDVCGTIVPAGGATAEAGELVITTDEFFGISLIGLRPSFVDDEFPEDTRDYSIRLRVNIESINQFLIYTRARVGVDEETEKINSELERGYALSLIPEGVETEAGFTDGLIALTEWEACHESVNHPEWPNVVDNFARVPAGFPIERDTWYWVEFTALGPDDGGPVLLTGMVWPDGEDPPETPQLVATDLDGLPHTPETLAPEANSQFFLGADFDLEPRPLTATVAVDDVTLTSVNGCPDAPAVISRALWGNTEFIEGADTALYDEGETYSVRLDILDVRSAGDCEAAGIVTIVDTAPPGWQIISATAGGEISEDESSVTFQVNLEGAGGGIPEIAYEVDAATGGAATFSGQYNEPESDFAFTVSGEAKAVPSAGLAAISDFGSIQQWLILGPYTRDVEGNAPGEDEIRRDYLTDAEDIEEATVRPRAGDTVATDFAIAASADLAPDNLGRNPMGDQGIASWVQWIDLDDDDDRIDIESIYGDLDEIMIYAVTYLNVSDDVTVNFGVSSDDSVQLLLDGEEIHLNNRGRGAQDRAYQDLPFEFESLGNVELTEGQHILMVKLFEGGGENNFRVGFVDEIGLEIPGGPPEVTISLEPETDTGGPRFVRADPDSSGSVTLTDGVVILNGLFRGGDIACNDAADSDDGGAINLTDAVFIFRWLFGGGNTPPPPSPTTANYGPEDCGLDPSEDTLGCETPAAKCT